MGSDHQEVFAADRATTLRTPCAWALWGDECGARYVGGDAARIACEQRPVGHGGMRADQEVWEDGLARSSRATVVGVGVTGEERRRCRDRLDDRHRGQRRMQFLDAWEPWRDLGEHDRVEDERASLGCLRELLLRPGQPVWVLSEEVE
jgi:hypothetical protein